MMVFSCTKAGFGSDIRKTLSSEIMVWHRLPREVVKSLCLEVFKKYVDVALRDTVGMVGMG